MDKLPAELRLMIYSYAIPRLIIKATLSAYGTSGTEYVAFSYRRPAVRQLCREARNFIDKHYTLIKPLPGTPLQLPFWFNHDCDTLLFDIRTSDLRYMVRLFTKSFGRTSISRFGLRLKPFRSGQRDLPLIAQEAIFEGVPGLTVDVETTKRDYVSKHFLANLPSATTVVVTETNRINFPEPLRPSNVLGEYRWVRGNQTEEQEAEAPVTPGEVLRRTAFEKKLSATFEAAFETRTSETRTFEEMVRAFFESR